MRIVIAGGGTGGHTSAGLAVAAALGRHGITDVQWIGSRHGIEARRVPEAGLAYHTIATGKLRRYWDWRNVTDLGLRVPTGFLQSRRLLRRLAPNLLFATGGFVALPPALAARSLGVPVIVHEQTAVPGLANRIAGRFARRIALTFPLTGEEFPRERIVLTGNPIRPELLGGSREEGCRLFGLTAARPVVYVTGGSQGSHRINRTVGATLGPLLEIGQIIHQAGANLETGDLEWLEEQARQLPERLGRRYALRPHVGAELRHIYAAADLVVGRSGAGTVTECCHLGRPALYIPLPGTRGDEQTANARLAEAARAAVLLPQVSLTPERLLEAITALLSTPAELRAMGERARSLAVPDAADRIARLILEAVGP
ncbi:MAG: undecaprenyldiphospho-muramoylpentapeptide beta-N-acetylglucosaminyltransferase [Candidatus Rokubacteria bacterium]|nr:undecaprenyldiphospho-muramoylpentapeptide beta-N-acetylglucosaminyltransferase [Candidatus Rokubacteria bacterium]